MLKINDDDKVTKMTEDENRMQKKDGQDVLSLINSGLHGMLKMNDDDKVMRMTEDEMMIQNVMNDIHRMDEMANCARPYQ